MWKGTGHACEQWYVNDGICLTGNVTFHARVDLWNSSVKLALNIGNLHNYIQLMLVQEPNLMEVLKSWSVHVAYMASMYQHSSVDNTVLNSDKNSG